MSESYVWITKEGAPAGPRHCTITTAARWLARAPRRPRTAPKPWMLTAQRRTGRSRVLSSAERADLVRLLVLDMGVNAPPASVERWLRNQARIVAERQRRRVSLGLLTAPLQDRRDIIQPRRTSI